MEIKKLKSETVGTHYPNQVVIFTDKGEIFVTKDEETSEGFELLKFQTYDLQGLTTIINNLLRGVSLTSKALVQVNNQAIAVSPVANLYTVDSSTNSAILNNIIGGYESQVITVTSNLPSLEISNLGNIQVNPTITLNNPYSTLLLQKSQGSWLVLSNKNNQ